MLPDDSGGLTGAPLSCSKGISDGGETRHEYIRCHYDNWCNGFGLVASVVGAERAQPAPPSPGENVPPLQS